ncbi:beta-ketoacyl-[acyl-carrier-protein] synthase family protein [Phreatobacter cathodiphilus]|uniref:beta-ketoacyl-[acyl-carrier-protein] synthase family protein n=1 Tax=Phreatobacter cathodiphilus TaxID=1868589 RepID=UPI0026875553
MTSRSVVVTGLGALTTAGHGVEALWTAAATGVSGVKQIVLDYEFGNNLRIAAQVQDFDLERFFPHLKTSFFDRVTLMALIAADEAVKDAGLAEALPLGPRTSVIVGTGIASLGTIEESSRNMALTQKRPDPLTVPRAMISASASNVGLVYGCTGTTFVVSSACASSAQALGIAFHMVRAGLTDRAIVVGSEAIVTPGGMKAWEMLRVLSPQLCRPFSRGRNGLLLGEGSAALVIEAEEVAAARGARIRGRLLGYGTTSDAKDMLKPDVGGAAEAMTLALADAGLGAEAVGYVNAHGTATILNDSTESEALGRVFGEKLGTLPVSSTKPIHGHTLGAAGAIEAVVTIRALEEGFVPPTINFLEADPACPIDCVANVGRSHAFDVALTNSFAFGGINASLAIGRAA